MLHNARIIAEGNHENVHFKITVGGTKKKPLFSFKLVGFLDSGNVFITSSNIQDHMREFCKFVDFRSLLQQALNKFDFDLVMFSDSDIFNKGKTTEYILKRLIHEKI